jgi:hypothetical protein
LQESRRYRGLVEVPWLPSAAREAGCDTRFS